MAQSKAKPDATDGGGVQVRELPQVEAGLGRSGATSVTGHFHQVKGQEGRLHWPVPHTGGSSPESKPKECAVFAPKKLGTVSKRPSGEWGAGAAGAEPGPKGAGAAQAGPGGAGRWIKQ